MNYNIKGVFGMKKIFYSENNFLEDIILKINDFLIYILDLDKKAWKFYPKESICYSSMRRGMLDWGWDSQESGSGDWMNKRRQMTWNVTNITYFSLLSLKKSYFLFLTKLFFQIKYVSNIKIIFYSKHILNRSLYTYEIERKKIAFKRVEFQANCV